MLCCSCTKGCSTNQCGCKKLGLFCTDICNCDHDCCENKTNVFDDEDVEDDLDDNDLDD